MNNNVIMQIRNKASKYSFELLSFGRIDNKWEKQEIVAIAIMFSYRDRFN